MLRFIEDTFGLGTLTKSDGRATSPEQDCFDFGKPARAYVPIPTPYNAHFFEHQPLDPRPPDDD